jgi:photosystem II stability/assembly factor-like uncharacterized protein
MTQVTSLASVLNYEKVWGDPDKGVGPFIVGDRGLIYKRSGANWDSLAFTTITEKFLTSVWGSSPTNVLVTGFWDDFIYDTAYDTTDDDVDTVPYTADAPILTRYNGATFIDFVIDVEWGLYDVWGTAPDTAFAVGYDGTLLQYNGTQWTVVTTNGDGAVWLNSVWGTSNHNVYASGSLGALVHYDGSEWSIVPTKTGQSLWDVWGFSDTSIYLVGSNGIILHYGGSEFTSMETDVSNTLYSVWGSSENNIYAVGWGGTILHYDGVAWSEMVGVTDFGFLSVWGSGPNDIYFVGQTVLHYDGADFAPVRLRGEPDFLDIWFGSEAATGTKEAVVVGTGGLIMLSTGGNSFGYHTVDGSSITADLYGVGGHVDTATFIVGAGGTILQRDRADLGNWLVNSSPVMTDLYAVSVLSEDVAYAVGAAGVILEYDGTDWTRVANGLTSETLRDVWVGTVGSDTVVFAVGDQGTTVRFDGLTWSSPSAVALSPLKSVVGLSNGDALAVGIQGWVLKYSASAGTWGTLPVTGTIENLTSIWAADNSTQFIAAESGRVFKLVGTTLTEIETSSGFDLSGIYGISATDFFAVGDFNHIFHYAY